jgi:hypothetical protein
MDTVTCKDCNKDVTPTDAGVCPDCGAQLVDMPSDKPTKSLDLRYAKSIGLVMPDAQMRKTLAAKFVSPDTIHHYIFLWGNPQKTDLEAEYFKSTTNFWDGVLGHTPRPLTWDHAQDRTMKADPVIGKTVEWGDDDLGRWALSHLDRAHVYRKAVDMLIEEGVIGTSSDSAAQYVEREEHGKSAFLKTWPWFASALTDAPCEHRMVGTVEHFKSLGLNVRIPEAPDAQVRAMVQKAQSIFAHSLIFGE